MLIAIIYLRAVRGYELPTDWMESINLQAAGSGPASLVGPPALRSGNISGRPGRSEEAYKKMTGAVVKI